MIGIMHTLRSSFNFKKLADGSGYAAADRITVINSSFSLIKHIMINNNNLNHQEELFMTHIIFIMLLL